MFAVARLLTHAGIPVRTAKRVVDDLAAGRMSYVEAPSVGDYDLRVVGVVMPPCEGTCT